MAKQKNISSVETATPKVEVRKPFGIIKEKILNRKKLLLGIFVVLLIAFIFFSNFARKKQVVGSNSGVKTVSLEINKGFEFKALDHQGRPVNQKIKFKIASVEKTNQVMVKDQSFTAKNKKMFLIVNLELKNDASIALNILPGDLVRMTYSDDDNNKYAPDLHNNLVLISAISTKLDRIGFVVPQDAKDFKLYIGELEGKKETVLVNF